MNNWSQMVNDLNAAGMTYAEIGSVIHLAPSTVGDLAKGRYKEPRYKSAVALIALHKKVMRPPTPSKKEAA